MPWPLADLQAMAGRAALDHGLDPKLLAAIVSRESSWDPWAWNPEPRYQYFWDLRKSIPFRKVTEPELASKRPPADFPALAGDRDQEWWGQQASWGLMQVMGAVARECGFRGPYLPATLDPFDNLRLGCIHLRRKIHQAEGDIRHALLLWNGGGNPRYPQEVLTRIA